MLTRSEQQASESEYFKVYPIGKVEKKDGRTFIVLGKEYEAGLKGLEKHSYVHVVYWFMFMLSIGLTEMIRLRKEPFCRFIPEETRTTL
ncbi:MAG: hypothetical protein ACYS30_20395 [Planctomycetota bacterium]|jgi:tRNA (Thr-GGU) A37 N-methylase